MTLKFNLEVEDGWPPVAVEALPFATSGGRYTLLAAPLYVKELSVGDVIAVELDHDDTVTKWRHLSRAHRSTIWLLRMKPQPRELDSTLRKLRALGCNTVSSAELGSYAVDVPEDVPMERVDAVLASLDAEDVAVAFPSFRHPDGA